jgi:hypothetical protein
LSVGLLQPMQGAINQIAINWGQPNPHIVVRA